MCIIEPYVNNVYLFTCLFTCLFICRSPGPANTGNPSRRQTGSRLCEEAETTICHVKRITREEREEQTRGANSLHTSQRLALILRVNGGRRLKKGNKRRGGGVVEGEKSILAVYRRSLSLSLSHRTLLFCLSFLPAFNPEIRLRSISV